MQRERGGGGGSIRTAMERAVVYPREQIWARFCQERYLSLLFKISFFFSLSKEMFGHHLAQLHMGPVDPHGRLKRSVFAHSIVTPR